MSAAARSVLVAGASGRLGRAVLARLATRGVAAVRGTSDADTIGMIAHDGRATRGAFRGIEAVINCAGRAKGDPSELRQANVAFPLALAESARAAGVARFVQVSSFSVFGRVARIDATSPLKPDNAYGETKLRAEQGLRELAGDGFGVSVLRVPFLFSAEWPGLLQPLIRMICRTGLVPVRTAGEPIERSMMTYDDAAASLVALAGGAEGKVLAAADPLPLSMERLADIVESDRGRKLTRIAVSSLAARAIGMLAPRIRYSLLSSSVLDPAINFAIAERGRGVEDEIVAYVRGYCSAGAG